MISPETAGHVFLKQADVHTLLRLSTGILIRSLPLAQPSAFPSRSLLPANSGLRPRSQGERALLRPQARSQETVDIQTLDLRPSAFEKLRRDRTDQQTLQCSGRSNPP